MTDVLPEALRSALGQVIADQRREWRRERELDGIAVSRNHCRIARADSRA
jgi:hypothetical protein